MQNLREQLQKNQNVMGDVQRKLYILEARSAVEKPASRGITTLFEDKNASQMLLSEYLEAMEPIQHHFKKAALEIKLKKPPGATE